LPTLAIEPSALSDGAASEALALTDCSPALKESPDLNGFKVFFLHGILNFD
jgi:hypothetical protein